MRLAIHVPKAQADRWSPVEGSISFSELQRRIVNLTGGITVMQASGHWTGGRTGYVQEPVLVVEALAPSDFIDSPRYASLWALLRCYAAQLLEAGEEAVLIVQDNEPTLIHP